MPGLDFEKGGWGIGYDEESGDVVINHDIPSVDIDLPDLDLDVDIKNPCEEGQILDKMGVCQWPDIPNPCEEGQVLDELGVCQWPDLPDIANPCEEGQILDKMGVCQWPDLPDITNPCEEGQILDQMGVCQWPDLENPCEEGQVLDELGVCQWPDLPDIEVAPDGTDCEDGFNWDSLLGQCVEIEVGDDIDEDIGDIDLDVDLDIPEPEEPDFTPHTNDWSELFAYTPVDTTIKRSIAPLGNYITQARGMLDDIYRTS